ncbi:DeoR/GlpR transcriptional regulator [Brevibacillus sp. SYP-B805]|uniref:DeoR/GlpR family DNA-binding transcription regulator n=1 Tax=Brevibacillus sp. SYP-B805 TaxID=1578199 RepID=UPI0013E9E901|nr:DeoR/GlpR family DNA-binding transcription regulator [Brevibacillus sp. SYP-B805]NGQ96977.1 DeoR/GlpR transcriptional regulator [Brevibacillus sp. SYP-B805]
MYQEERLDAIMAYLQEHKRVSVQEICERFGVSRDTARRDIVKLEEQGLILRTRGGAILPTLSKRFHNYAERLQMESGEKHRIALLAASLIKDNDYLIMDASTTVLFAAECLTTKNNVVVTNSIDIAAIVGRKEQAKVYLLGGCFHPAHRFVYGQRAIEMMAEYHADKLLIGAGGIARNGLTNPSEEESHLLKEMMKRADQVIVLADHSKFDVQQFVKVAGWDQIDMLVTDREPQGELAEALKQHEVDVLVAETEKHR